MLESRAFFTRMVDELVDLAQHDPELADGLRWLDGQARERQISFYDMVFEVLYRHDADARARIWMRGRN